MSRAAWLAAAALLGGLAASAGADPMRPLILPAAASAAAGNAAAPAGAGAASAALSTTAAPAAATPAPVALSAIRQDSAGRWQALFGERWLAVGDRLDGQPLTAIDSNTVRLGRGAGARTLQLLPTLQADNPPVAGTAQRRHAKTFASDTRTP